MEARKKTLIVLKRHLQGLERAQFESRIKTAAFDEDEGFKPKKVGVDNEVGGHLKRAIPKDHPYNPKAIKPLAKMLWAMSVALGHALTAHRQFTKVKSSTISPDGLMGGRGYVMSVKDVRKTLYNACEGLSVLSDTIHDELNAPHWKPKLAELEKKDIEGIERLVGEAEQFLENPEEEVEEGMEEAEESGEQAELEEGEGSKLPGPGSNGNDDLADSQADNSRGVNQTIKQASYGKVIEHPFQTKAAAGRTLLTDETAEAVIKSAEEVRANPVSRTVEASVYTYRRGNSSIPVETLSGPRVQHMDRGDTDQTGPYGSYNIDEPQSVQDEWSRDDGAGDDYLYQSEWDNELLDKTSGSNLPGTLTDRTPTEGKDFGLGYGEGNDAHGQGTDDYGLVDSDGRGVYGPHAQLPDDPGGMHGEESDTTPITELEVSRSSLPRRAKTTLPNDVLRTVARSDYYDGDKGDNEVNATSDLPSVPENDYEYQKDVQPGMGYKFEDGFQPYIKWDSDTHNMREDYVYQRDVDDSFFEREG